jgi:hypothetical protein
MVHDEGLRPDTRPSADRPPFGESHHPADHRLHPAEFTGGNGGQTETEKVIQTILKAGIFIRLRATLRGGADPKHRRFQTGRRRLRYVHGDGGERR